MEIFAMIFAVFMIAVAIVVIVAFGFFVGSIWAALAFAALLVFLYRVMTNPRGPTGDMKRDQLSAFQRPLSDD
jgi:hypothetical protein